MADQILCVCGAVLLDDIDERGVLLVGSKERITFRRTTDHVICARCMRSYGIRDLAARTDSPVAIEELERMISRIDAQRDPDQG